MGNKELKDVLAGLFSLHMAYDRAAADGKVDLSDLGQLIDPISKLPAAIGGAKLALEQLKGLDDAEKKEVMDFVKASYDIADDVLEMKVEQGIDAALGLAKFIGILKEKPAAEPAPAE